MHHFPGGGGVGLPYPVAVEPWLQTALIIALLLALPASCALLLRSAGAPGSAVLGGVLAGILLGPTLFGRIAPEAYEAIFVGGEEERAQLERVVHRQGADLLAGEAAGLDLGAIEEIQQEHAAERSLHQGKLNEARWEHQRPLRIMTAIIVMLTLLASGLIAIPRADPHSSFISPLSIGIWAAALPGAIAYLAAVRWWGWSVTEGALVAAAVMIGPWALAPFDREAADQAELGGARMIELAGRVSTLLAIAIAAWVLFPFEQARGVLWALVLLAVVLGWLLPSVATPALRTLVRTVVVSTLAALAAIRIDLFAHFAFWPILILLILSGDGRWVGAVMGALLLGGRSVLRTMRLALGSMACGPTQLAIVAIAAHLWLLREEAVFALVVGALVIEITAPLRRSMAGHLADAEEWELE